MTTTAQDGTAADTGHRTPVPQRWVLPASLFVGLLVVYAATAARAPRSVDVTAAGIEAWRLATTRRPWLEGVYHHLVPNPWLQLAPNGHVVADRMAGPVIASWPFYLLRGGPTAASSFSVVPSGLAAALLTAATATLMFSTIAPRAGRRVGVVAALAFALATPTWSVSADAMWTHTLTQFGIAGAAYGASRSRYWLAGAFLAAGMTGRPHLALVAAVLGLGLGWTRRSLWPALAIGFPTLTALALLSVWGHWMFGVWTFSTPGYGSHSAAALGGAPVVAGLVGVRAHLVNDLGFLVSPHRGLLVWTPVLLVLGPAVLRARRGLPAWSVWLALGGVAYTLAQLQMEEFTGGTWFYGYRYGLELLTCCTPMLAFSWCEVGRLGRHLVPLLLALQVGVIGLGASASALFVVDGDPWHYNGFLQACRAAPGFVVSLLVVCTTCGLVVPRLVRHRVDESTRPGSG